MKRIILISIILFVAVGGYSQQDIRQYNYYSFDEYYLNPAYVGAKDYYALNVAYDTWYSGMKDASPKTVLLTAHSRVGEGYLFEKDGKINKFFSKFGNMALGTQNMYFNFGPQYEYIFAVTYGYHLPLSPNSKTKRPRKLIMAFSPRLIVTGFNRNKLTNNDGIIIDNDYDVLLPPVNESMNKANFVFDVGAVYQNTFSDIGFSVLNISNSKNGFDSDTIAFGATGYTLYDSVYSPKLVLDAKLKFLNIISEDKLEINFVPKTAFLYAPNSGNMEFFLDLSVNWNFYKKVTSYRRNLEYQIVTGLFIDHRRNFKPFTKVQPYVAFDFMNYVIQYSYSFNPNVEVPQYWGGNQISILFNLDRKRVVYGSNKKGYWK